jgi:hypothetical protein
MLGYNLPLQLNRKWVCGCGEHKGAENTTGGADGAEIADLLQS